MSDQDTAIDRSANDNEPSEHGWTRSPMAAIAIAVIAGILIDRGLSLAWWFWTFIAAGLMIATWVSRRDAGTISTVLLLGGCVAIGGMRHHLSWSAVARDDIGRLATIDSQPVHVTGVIASPVTIVAADDSEMTPPWMRIDRSMCDLRCETVVNHGRRIRISGSARLIITGHLLHVGIGDRVDLVGQLASPRGASNPGAYDYQQHLRRRGMRCIIACNHPEAVQIVQQRASNHMSRWRSELRNRAEAIFVQQLDRRTAPLASSLLLGERTHLPEDVRQMFVESGTMHLLAISGLHVGILAGLLLVACRLLNLSVMTTTLVLLMGIGAYAFVTNLRPPVIRASVLAVVAAGSWPAFRRLEAVNLLAVCALVVLMINPTDLFDTGTQLSFLAVTAIGWASSIISRQRRRADGESLLPNLFIRRPGVAATLGRWLAEGYVVTTAIWLVTLPLTAAQFHIAAPVGFVVNVLLIPYVTLLLALGFCTLGFSLLLPWLVRWPAMLFDESLNGLMNIVDAASALHLGHVYLAGPPAWWLVMFYLLLGGVVLMQSRNPSPKWGWAAVWGWVIIGQTASFASPARESLRCTFLDVGHGCCVVLELPDGKTLLYDAGMFAGERRGQQIIQSALWERGIHRLDGVIVSHADVDHFNAALGLMRTMPVGMLLVSRPFLDLNQRAVATFCESAASASVPWGFLQKGDRIATDERVTLTVRHPQSGPPNGSDNANSTVIEVRFAGHSILLTGDLEQDGLAQLLQQSPRPIDVLMSPHHGSRNANPLALAEWASPRSIIASGGDEKTALQLAAIYPSAAEVYVTRDDGAITVEIQPDGRMEVRSFLSDKRR